MTVFCSQVQLQQESATKTYACGPFRRTQISYMQAFIDSILQHENVLIAAQWARDIDVPHKKKNYFHAVDYVLRSGFLEQRMLIS